MYFHYKILNERLQFSKCQIIENKKVLQSSFIFQRAFYSGSYIKKKVEENMGSPALRTTAPTEQEAFNRPRAWNFCVAYVED